ncbi:MAG: hypothetical protein AAB922_01985, partial [Patescibacteria group bacterium]
LGLTGRETFTIPIDELREPGQKMSITVTSHDGSQRRVECLCRLDSTVECTYFQNEGILPFVLRELLKNQKKLRVLG